jgi:Transposase DDE domain
MRGPTFFAYADNYLIDVKFGVIMDVEASRAIRPAEVGAAKRMIERTEERFGIKPARLAADSAYGSAPTLTGLPTTSRSRRTSRSSTSRSGTAAPSVERISPSTRSAISYTCPSGKPLTTTRTVVNDDQLLYRASKRDCDICPGKMRCCPKEPARKLPCSIYKAARDIARALAKTAAFEQSRHDRKRVEMLFAHLKRILKLGRLRLRGPRGAQDEFTLVAIAQNLRRLAKLAAQPPPAADMCPG